MAYSYDRRRMAAGLRTRIDVKIWNWQGKRNILVKQFAAFTKDLAAIPMVGFSTLGGGASGLGAKVVQLDKKHLPKLEAILKKHGLRMEGSHKATRPMYDIEAVRPRVPHTR